MKALVLVLLAVASFGSYAETIYKSLDAKGRVIYSDEPIRGARIVERFVAPSERGARGPKARDHGTEATRAEQALAAAERALHQGRQPLPHETKAAAGGGSRLTEEYFNRVLELERAVEQTRKRLLAAQGELN